MRLNPLPASPRSLEGASTPSAAARPVPSARPELRGAADGFEPRPAQKPLALDPGEPTPTTDGTVTFSASASPNAEIPDQGSLTSTIEVTQDVPLDQLSFNVDLTHSYRQDLVVTLTSPSGKKVTLLNREGGSADDYRGTFDVKGLEGEHSQGTWTLTVEDKAARDVGQLNTWGLTFTGKGAAEENPDLDPMTHIKYFASDEVDGRNSPSEGLNLAAGYIKDRLVKYGLTGPNPTDPQNPYFQTFNVWGFANQGVASAQPEDGAAHGFGHTLFEHGFYADDQLSPEQLALLDKQYKKSLHGVQPAVPAITTVEDLKQVAVKQSSVQNVMGMLPGTGPHKDEVIVVMAHYDHLGTTSSGKHPGADDNASGSAALLASLPQLAQAQKDGKLDRSVLIVWTAAEEKGLVGAQYFVDHPIPGIGLDQITGVLNMDMVGRWDDQRLSVIDTDRKGNTNYLSSVMNQANGELADPFDRLNHDIDEYRERQDGAVFLKKGEDVLFVFEGLSNPEGGGDLNPDYHQPTDTVDKILEDNDGKKPGRVRDLLVNLVQDASNLDRTPPAQVAWP